MLADDADESWQMQSQSDARDTAVERKNQLADWRAQIIFDRPHVERFQNVNRRQCPSTVLITLGAGNFEGAEQFDVARRLPLGRRHAADFEQRPLMDHFADRLFVAGDDHVDMRTSSAPRLRWGPRTCSTKAPPPGKRPIWPARVGKRSIGTTIRSPRSQSLDVGFGLADGAGMSGGPDGPTSARAADSSSLRIVPWRRVSHCSAKACSGADKGAGRAVWPTAAAERRRPDRQDAQHGHERATLRECLGKTIMPVGFPGRRKVVWRLPVRRRSSKLIVSALRASGLLARAPAA